MAEELQSGGVRGENWWLNLPLFSGFPPYSSTIFNDGIAWSNPGIVFDSKDSRSSVVCNPDLVHGHGRSFDHYSQLTEIDSIGFKPNFDCLKTMCTQSTTESFYQDPYTSFPCPESSPFEYGSSQSSTFTSPLFDSGYVPNQLGYFGDLGMINSTSLPENQVQFAGSGNFPASFLHSSQPQFFTSSTDCIKNSNQVNCISQDSLEELPSAVPGSKRPRYERRTTLPTFKVRKEKLGGRIAALQQLVSPFGKTDTASVLHEAIESIKFLHDQVNVLSAPYFKSKSPPHQNQETIQCVEDRQGSIMSRGLCLVPVSSTYNIVTETKSEFWTPRFGGSFK